MNITRRKFIKSSCIAALAAVMAPAALLSTAGKPAAAAAVRPTNPLFTGALGRYEGVSIYESITAPIYGLNRAIFDAQNYGICAVKHSWIKDDLRAEWIPIDKIRPG